MLQLVKDSERFGEPARLQPRGNKRHRAVLKFGSSVLTNHGDLPRVAGEIYRRSLEFRQTFVVVSAFDGETDQLFARHELISGATECDGCADLVSLGEDMAAAQLKAACSRIGLETILLRPERWGILAEGAALCARPAALPPLPADVPAEGVVIVPGFVGLNEKCERVLLGRGGSDYTAIYLAGELGADCVRLYKDVDGVFDHDPAEGGRELHRYDEIDWSKCLEIARPLLQPEAVEYARDKALTIEVGSVASRSPTLVTNKTKLAPAVGNRPLSVGIAGFGVVGQALYQRLIRERGFKVSGVLVRNIEKPRTIYPPFGVSNDLRVFLSTPFDIIVDATSGEEAGLPLAFHQLGQGRALISANKIVVEPWYEELEGLCRREGGHFGISACVGGGTPILETIGQLADNGIARVDAVLNGTVNYLLDRLAEGQSFEAALEDAQLAGFAEADPSQDLSGRDAELKLRLVARVAFSGFSGGHDIRTESLDATKISTIKDSGERWLQLASLVREADHVEGSISFVRAGTIERLPSLSAERNFARVTLFDGREFDVVGRGAGGPATAEAIVSDMFAFKNRSAGELRKTQNISGVRA